MLGFMGLCLLAAVSGVSGQQTGNHTDWDRWCGKVYEPGFPSFDPGGHTLPPTPVTGPSLLDVQFRPRYSLYLDNEKQGQFIVNAPLSQFFGKAWPEGSTAGSSSSSKELAFTITLASDNGKPLVKDVVPINSTGNLFTFDLSRLTPSTDPVKVILTVGPEGSSSTIWTANTTILYLPFKPTTGSVTRIDNLHGGLFFSNPASHHSFVPLFPYGFYASYDGFLADVTTANTTILDAYAGLGLNAMCPLTIYADGAPALDHMDAIDLKFMYDLRENYKNLTYVSEQVIAARGAEAIFTYWSADEPDGWQDPFSAPVDAQAVLHQLDPYHPVAIVLNCQDYYFGPYTAGADIIMEDVYPIGINTTFSKWGTDCNTTLGDCGCDNCPGDGPVDVATRLDDLSKYERWLNLWPKTKFHNPQSFHGEDYWSRDPTPEEEWAMVLLAVNHGAKGIISWVWPATHVLGVAHGQLAKVLTVSPVVDFVVGGDSPRKVDVGIPGVDVAVWVVGKKMLVSVVNGGYVDVGQTVKVPVPGAKGIASVPWGGGNGWTLAGGKLSVPSLKALSTTLLILDVSSCIQKSTV